MFKLRFVSLKCISLASSNNLFTISQQKTEYMHQTVYKINKFQEKYLKRDYGCLNNTFCSARA